MRAQLHLSEHREGDPSGHPGNEALLSPSFEGWVTVLGPVGANASRGFLLVLVRSFGRWRRLAAGAPDDDRDAEHDERPKERKHSESPEAGLRAAR
jgi:hypothetical protein